MDAAYGISRTRDKKGEIIKQTTLPWVNCIHRNAGGSFAGMIYGVGGIAPTINTSGGGQREPLILVCEEKK